MKTKFVTGQRFKANIQGAPVEGKIYVDGDDAWLCQDHYSNDIYEGYLNCPDNLGYKYTWKFRNEAWLNNTKIWGVTDLEILSDTDEPEVKQPVMGDLVICSNLLESCEYGIKGTYTGYKCVDDGFLVHTSPESALFFKHIRLAPPPQPTKRQLAEKKARQFCIENDCNTVTVFEALTDYILKNETA